MINGKQNTKILYSTLFSSGKKPAYQNIYTFTNTTKKVALHIHFSETFNYSQMVEITPD